MFYSTQKATELVLYCMYRFSMISIFFRYTLGKIKSMWVFYHNFFRGEDISLWTSLKQEKAHEVKFYNWIL